MKNFLFKDVSPSIFDCELGFTSLGISSVKNATIGELVTIGKAKKHTVLYIPSSKIADDSNIDWLNHYECEGDKVMQYVSRINGYLLAATNF